MKIKLIFCLFWAIQSISAQIVRLDSSNLPICIIDTRGKTIANEPKILSHMKIIYNGPGKMNYLKGLEYNYNNFIAIEIRGNSSQSYPQKQFSLELRDSLTGNDLDASLIDMPAEEDWVLYAPYNDISMLRNVLTYHLWNVMGHWGPRTRFCELILNNEYQGIYILMETIKQGTDRVDVAKLKASDSTGRDLTGGYIMKIDKKNNANDKSFISKVKATNNQNITWLFHYPESDDITAIQQDYIHKYIDTVEQLIASADFADPITGYSKYLSTNSFIDYFLITELSRNVDAYKASSFFYKEKLQEDGSKGKLKAGPVWDYNFAFGNASFCSGAQFTGWMYDGCMPATLPTPILWKRLLGDVNYLNAVKCRYVELRKTIWDTNYIFRFLDRYAFDTIDNAQKRHFTKWKILGTNPGGFNGYIANSYPDEMNKLKSWIRSRLNWMDNNLQGVCVPPTPTQIKMKIPLDPGCVMGSRPLVQVNQPFDVFPFLYKGNEKLNQIPSNIVRWVLIELRSAKDSSQLIDRRAALVRNDSFLVDSNFQTSITFLKSTPNENYYIVIRYSEFAFLMSKNKIKLPNVTALNFNIQQNIVVPSYESSIIFNNQWLPSDTLILCKGAKGVINDSNLIKLGFSNLDMSILNPNLNVNILNRHEVEISGDSIGIFPLTIYQTCKDQYVIRNELLVNILPAPLPEITSLDTFCIGDSMLLKVGKYAAYEWSNGSTLQEIFITTANNYSVTVTDGNSCSGVISKTVENYQEIDGSIITLSGNSPNTCRLYFNPTQPKSHYSYEWSNGSHADTLETSEENITLIVRDENGCKKSFTATCIPVNLEVVYNKGMIRLFPNPNSGLFTIESQFPMHNIAIKNVMGQELEVTKIEEKSIFTQLLNLNMLAPGVYLIEVRTAVGIEVCNVWIK